MQNKLTSTPKMKTDPIRLNFTLAKAIEGGELSKRDITFLLDLEDSEQIDWLFQAACHLRTKHFGNEIFLYGFIYASTYCRNDCRFCLFNQLRPGQDYDLRLEAKLRAHKRGMLIEEGLLCGVGETANDIAESMAVMHDLDADQMRVMNFVPQPGTPMVNRIPLDSKKELLISAVMRLVFPDRLIPASLDVDGLAGLKQRLEAGANVVTSIVPPGRGLAGVARHSLDIEEGKRTIASVEEILPACGLRPASAEKYLSWITRRMEALGKSFNSILPSIVA